MSESENGEAKTSAKPKKKKRKAGSKLREGRADVPGFARGFPADAEIDRLVALFEAGNYAAVREEASALAARTDRPAVRDAARELLRRIDPDPLAIFLLCAAVMLLVFLSYWYWSNPQVAP